MENLSRYFDVEDMFCTLFMLAGQQGIKKDVFTRSIESHNFVISIEKGDYANAYNESILDVFNDSLSFYLSDVSLDTIYNDYYWVGKCYFYIQSETKKSFSYIFLKLPFDELYRMYDLYHEMDMGKVLEVFKEKEKETTILKKLCERRKIKIPYLSKETNIPITTLTKYKKSDEYLYSASFKNIYQLTRYFEVPETLFLEEVPQEK